MKEVYITTNYKVAGDSDYGTMRLLVDEETQEIHNVSYITEDKNIGTKVTIDTAENGWIITSRGITRVTTSFHELEKIIKDIVITRTKHVVPFDESLWNEDDIEQAMREEFGDNNDN